MSGGALRRIKAPAWPIPLAQEPWRRHSVLKGRGSRVHGACASVGVHLGAVVALMGLGEAGRRAPTPT